MTKLHHVNVTVPFGRSKPIASFYCDVLGLHTIERPENDRSGVWLEMGDGTQLHLSEREGAPHPDQHFAVVVDDLSAVRVRLGEPAPVSRWPRTCSAPGAAASRTTRPANRIELIAKGL